MSCVVFCIIYDNTLQCSVADLFSVAMKDYISLLVLTSSLSRSSFEVMKQNTKQSRILNFKITIYSKL